MRERPKCTLDYCDRERATQLHCQSHNRQWKKYGECWPFGDKTKDREHRKAAWARLSEDEKKARIAPMIAGVTGVERTAEHSRRLSESLRARWQADGPEIPDRDCRGCGITFTPNSNHHFWCDAECQAARRRLRKHGLTNREYLDLRESQGGTCALCKSSGKGYGGSRYALVVDHCHDSGKVRGLLCPDCNTALGRFGDDATRLRAAADYIDRTCPH